MAQRPNILVIQTDDHGQWAANCYGCRDLLTPNMDYLASSGARMDRAFTPCAVCSPARASFWTGRIPSSHGIHDYVSDKEPGQAHPVLRGQTTLAEQLQEAGYRTGLAGKWHCGRPDIQPPGFDFWSARAGTGAHFGEHVFAENGQELRFLGHPAPLTTDLALRFLRSGGQDGDERPFFLYVGYVDTHSPFSGGPERLAAHYRRHPLRCIAEEPYSPAHGDIKWQPEPDAYAESVAQYAAAVTTIDEQIGRLLDELSGMEQLDNTLVVYTSDHGHNNGQYGLWLKGNGTTPVNFLDGSILVPGLLRWPGRIEAGQVRQEPVDHCDLHATLLDAADVVRSETETAATHGRSYLRLLGPARAEVAWRGTQFCEHGNSRMARSADGKLIRRYPGPNGHFRDAFFDLAADPRETTNRIDDPSCQDRIAALGQELDAFFAQYEVAGRRGIDVETMPRHNFDQPWERPLGAHARAMLR